jgi:hypothetical protein
MHFTYEKVEINKTRINRKLKLTVFHTQVNGKEASLNNKAILYPKQKATTRTKKIKQQIKINSDICGGPSDCSLLACM